MREHELYAVYCAAYAGAIEEGEARPCAEASFQEWAAFLGRADYWAARPLRSYHRILTWARTCERYARTMSGDGVEAVAEDASAGPEVQLAIHLARRDRERAHRRSPVALALLLSSLGT